MSVPAGSGAGADVSVIVVSYNAQEWLARCLEAVTSPEASEREIEVVVVDNDSDPAVQRFLEEAPGGVRVLQQPRNLGFGRACNLGVRESTGRLVLLVNPDAVVRPGAIDALAGLLEEDPGRGVVGGRTVTPDGTLDPSSCWGAPTLWSWFCDAVGLTAAFRRSALFDPESLGRWQRDTVREVDIVTGCLLLTSRDVWERLGGFDEDYFMYGEDADLSLRARAAGYRPTITPEAEAVHAVGASSPALVDKKRLLLRGKATLARKRWSPGKRWAGLVLLRTGVGVRAVVEWAGRRHDRTMRRLWAERADWVAGWPPSASNDGAPTTWKGR